MCCYYFIFISGFIFILMGNVVIIEDRTSACFKSELINRSLRSFTVDLAQTGPISDPHFLRKVLEKLESAKYLIYLPLGLGAEHRSSNAQPKS
jgi:hypothetical protein